MTQVFDPTKPVQTRDGRKARIIATDRGGRFPIVALVTTLFGEGETIISVRWDGRVNGEEPTALDLMNVPEEPKVTHRYFALYPKTDEKGAEASEFTEVAAIALSRCPSRPMLKLTFYDGKYAGTEVLV